MLPFPLPLLTWRECIVGFQPTEMVYMQVEKNWVHYNPVGTDWIGNGSAAGRNLGSVKWSMREDAHEGHRVRVLHSECYELKTGELRIEETYVDPATNALVYQFDQRTTYRGNERAECEFMPDRVEIKRTLVDGRTVRASMMPAEGMEAVQRRFVPMGDAPKDFLTVDGVRETFHKVHIEPDGHYRGNWGVDRFAGKAYRVVCDGVPQTVMLSEAGEIVKVEFTKDVSLALMGQPKSRRYEDNLPNARTAPSSPAQMGTAAQPRAQPTKQGVGARA